MVENTGFRIMKARFKSQFYHLAWASHLTSVSLIFSLVKWQGWYRVDERNIWENIYKWILLEKGEHGFWLGKLVGKRRFASSETSGFRRQWIQESTLYRWGKPMITLDSFGSIRGECMKAVWGKSIFPETPVSVLLSEYWEVNFANFLKAPTIPAGWVS